MGRAPNVSTTTIVGGGRFHLALAVRIVSARVSKGRINIRTCDGGTGCKEQRFISERACVNLGRSLFRSDSPSAAADAFASWLDRRHHDSDFRLVFPRAVKLNNIFSLLRSCTQPSTFFDDLADDSDLISTVWKLRVCCLMPCQHSESTDASIGRTHNS